MRGITPIVAVVMLLSYRYTVTTDYTVHKASSFKWSKYNGIVVSLKRLSVPVSLHVIALGEWRGRLHDQAISEFINLRLSKAQAESLVRKLVEGNWEELKTKRAIEKTRPRRR